jgi:hypothetical protein
LFTDEGPTGEAIRRFWQISKGLTTSGVLDGDEVSEVNDDIDGDALDDLEELPENERRRNPGMSKAHAFAKVPANADLAAKERRQHRPRA